MDPRTRIHPDVIPKTSTHQFVIQRNLSDDNTNSNNETSNPRYENDLINIFQCEIFVFQYKQSSFIKNNRSKWSVI